MAAALTAGGVIVFNSPAAENSQPQGRFHGQFLERAKEKLGLSDDQVAQIKAQLASEKDNLKSLVMQLHDRRAELRAAIQASGANESSVRAASAKVASVEADFAVERMKLYAKISPILTSDQLAKVQEFQSRLDDFLDTAINRLGERLAAQ